MSAWNRYTPPNPRRVTLKFRIALWLARRGWFRYEGMAAFTSTRGCPLAQVHYPEREGWKGWGRSRRDMICPEGYSVPMAIGNAVDYASLFEGATVVPLEVKHGQ